LETDDPLGIINNFLSAEFNISDRNVSFQELTKVVISVQEADTDRLLAIKKKYMKLICGSWIIE
jgi:hypothetical protein